MLTTVSGTVGGQLRQVSLYLQNKLYCNHTKPTTMDTHEMTSLTDHTVS